MNYYKLLCSNKHKIKMHVYIYIHTENSKLCVLTKMSQHQIIVHIFCFESH
jgi:hypothetical protein